MNKRIGEYVEELFAGAPSGKYSSEIKEELLANLNDKYNDLIAGGKSEDEAYSSVISSIGDLGGLLGEVQNISVSDVERKRTRRGFYIALSVTLYILALAATAFTSMFSDYLGGVVFLSVCAVATGILLFGISSTKNVYKKTDGTFVEEYREKVGISDKNAQIRKAVSSSLWSMTVLLYLVISFWTGMWHITWMIFILAAILQQLITFAYSPPKMRKRLWHGMLWTATVTVYLAVSFYSWRWDRTWMIFIVAIALEQAVRLFMLWGKSE